MKKTLLILAFFAVLSLGAMTPHFVHDPAISPDGSQICFAYSGDLWLVSAEGGVAQRLTSTNDKNHSPIWSPNGKEIAFTRTSPNKMGIYVMPATGGASTRVTGDIVHAIAWYDNDYLIGDRNISGRLSNYFKINRKNGRYVAITNFADHFGDLSPDGKKIIFNRRGDAYRKRYEGSGNGDLYEVNLATKTNTRLTTTPFTERYPHYSHAHKNRVYYVARANDNYQLFKVDNGDFLNPVQLTTHRKWSVRDISIARTSDKIAYELFNKIYIYNDDTGKSKEVKIEINEDMFEPTDKYTDNAKSVDKIQVSDDGKWMIFTHKYDLFAMPVGGGEVRQITTHQPGIGSFDIMPDNQTIVFDMLTEGRYLLYKASITDYKNYELYAWSKGKEIRRTYTAPDSTMYILYGKGEKRDLIAKSEYPWDDIDELLDNKSIRFNFIESPDGKYAVYTTLNFEEYSYNMYIYDFEKEKSQLLLTSGEYISSIGWLLDSKSIVFNKKDDITRLDIFPRDNNMPKEDKWEKALKSKDDKKDEDAKEDDAVAENREIDFATAKDRMFEIITTRGYNRPLVVLDDSTMYYINEKDNKLTIRKASFLGENDELVCKLPTAIKTFEYLEGDKKFYYTSKGSAYFLKPKGKPEKIDFKFEYTYDELLLNKRVFDQVWGMFGYGFYDANMNGVDWDASYKKYAPYTDYAYAPDVIGTIIDEMIGDVNASHTGYYPRQTDFRKRYQAVALGMRFDFSDRPSKGLKVKEIARGSVAYQVHGVRTGDVLLKINDTIVDRDLKYFDTLRDARTKPVKLKMKIMGEKKEFELKGLSWGENRELFYKEWVAQREDTVNKLGKGRIGYIHIQGMNQKSLRKFKDELWGKNYDKEALVIDVRNNGGGNIHNQLMDELAKDAYSYHSYRGNSDGKALTPKSVSEQVKVLLINEGSFSDAEIFPAVFKYKNYGTIIGTPTSGGVIGTRSRDLMDGSSMRMPFEGWWCMDGTNMELNGAQPDILVEQSLDQLVKDDDVQLKRAIEEVLRQLP